MAKGIADDTNRNLFLLCYAYPTVTSHIHNGKPDDFSEEDHQTLKFALLDISKKLADIAEKL